MHTLAESTAQHAGVSTWPGLVSLNKLAKQLAGQRFVLDSLSQPQHIKDARTKTHERALRFETSVPFLAHVISCINE